MRNAIVKLPEKRSPGERRHVLRAAVRQLERAEIYLAAASYMDIGDPPAQRAIARLRAELDGLHRHLSEPRVGIHS